MAKAKTQEKEILSTAGEKLGAISLNESVFGVEPNLHVMHLALRRQLNNARQGSACAKTRAEVRGGGRKPWKQKGTGRARAGSLRSPLFAGGGVSFGPKPRDYSFSMPQKATCVEICVVCKKRTNCYCKRFVNCRTKNKINGISIRFIKSCR